MAAHDPGSLLGGLLGQEGDDDPTPGGALGALLSAAGRAQRDDAANPLCDLIDVLARSDPPDPSAPPAPPAPTLDRAAEATDPSQRAGARPPADGG
ncbi:hypothetical protein ACFC09_35485 [Streptomyces sp. NPDC056161]|uniref:hypothetical protein n=1 Tax=Streptomyces sp. NPDC056161 TaxID=3345732 RepID=UPI0035DC06C5